MIRHSLVRLGLSLTLLVSFSLITRGKEVTPGPHLLIQDTTKRTEVSVYIQHNAISRSPELQMITFDTRKFDFRDRESIYNAISWWRTFNRKGEDKYYYPNSGEDLIFKVNEPELIDIIVKYGINSITISVRDIFFPTPRENLRCTFIVLPKYIDTLIIELLKLQCIDSAYIDTTEIIDFSRPQGNNDKHYNKTDFQNVNGKNHY